MKSNQNKDFLLRQYYASLQVQLLYAENVHCKSGWVLPPEILSCNKFFFIYAGEGWVRIGNEQLLPRPGQLLLLPEGQIQEVSEISDNRFKKFSCHFHALVGGLKLFDIIDVPYCIDCTNHTNYLMNLFGELVEYEHSLNPSDQIRAKGVMMEAIAFYLENSDLKWSCGIHADTTTSMNAAVDYMKKNLQNKITLEEIANAANLHPTYFIKQFKKYFGDTPIRYLNRLRVDYAKQLLVSSDLLINEIAEKAGFTDNFYFSKLFKQYTGHSPFNFRATQNIHQRLKI